MPQASSLAADLKEKYSVEAELIRGDGGIFDVTVDGELVFSKHQVGRFPENVEISDLIDHK